MKKSLGTVSMPDIEDGNISNETIKCHFCDKAMTIDNRNDFELVRYGRTNEIKHICFDCLDKELPYDMAYCCGCGEDTISCIKPNSDLVSVDGLYEVNAYYYDAHTSNEVMRKALGSSCKEKAKRFPVCDYCGKPVANSYLETISYDNKRYCRDCVYALCSKCGAPLFIDERRRHITMFDMSHYCSKECLETSGGYNSEQIKNAVCKPRKVPDEWLNVLNEESEKQVVKPTVFHSPYYSTITIQNGYCNEYHPVWAVYSATLLDIKLDGDYLYLTLQALSKEGKELNSKPIFMAHANKRSCYNYDLANCFNDGNRLKNITDYIGKIGYVLPDNQTWVTLLDKDFRYLTDYR